MSADQHVSPDEPITPEALRALARHHRTMGFPYSAQLIDLAANEIDRLNELVRSLSDFPVFRRGPKEPRW